jgi:Ca2+-binding RTX toxin-like protein
VVALTLASVAAACSPEDLEFDLGAEIYVIVEGPGAGAIIETPPGSSNVRSSGPAAYPVNALWSADGALVSHPVGCDGRLHYHGNLYGHPDSVNGPPYGPDGCGWGVVMRWNQVSPELGMAANSFAYEYMAAESAQPGTDPDDWDRALVLLARSLAILDDLEAVFPGADEWTNEIADLNEEAGDIVADDEATEEEIEHALDLLDQGLQVKADLIRAMTTRGLTTRAQSRCTIIGTPGPDTLRGTDRRDVACGLGGADIMLGLGGRDLLIGGEGPDRINGGSGIDVIRGGWHIDRIVTGPGKDRVQSGQGRDYVDGVRERF